MFNVKNTSISQRFSLVYVHCFIVKNISISSIQFSQTVLIQIIQFSINIVFIYTQLTIKTVLFRAIQFSLSTVSMWKQFAFQTIQFSISTQFRYQK